MKIYIIYTVVNYNCLVKKIFDYRPIFFYTANYNANIYT